MGDKPGIKKETFKLKIDKDFFAESYNNRLKVTIEQVIEYLRHTEKLHQKDPISNPMNGATMLRGLMLEGVFREELYDSLLSTIINLDAPYEIKILGDQTLIENEEK